MANPVVQTSICMCSFGMAPCPLMVSSQQNVMVSNMLAATIMDNKFPTFGMCSSLANPTVAAATSAAMGVLTPMPCVPAIAAPWIPGGAPTVLVGGKPALNNASKLMCNWGGIIQVNMTPAFTVMTP